MLRSNDRQRVKKFYRRCIGNLPKVCRDFTQGASGRKRKDFGRQSRSRSMSILGYSSKTVKGHTVVPTQALGRNPSFADNCEPQRCCWNPQRSKNPEPHNPGSHNAKVPNPTNFRNTEVLPIR